MNNPLPTKIVHLLSGGLDSTVLLYDLHKQGANLHCILFDYGQRHAKELLYAKRHCETLKVPFTLVELHRIKGLFSHCALTDGAGPVVVPNRNAVMLNIAVSIAASNCAELVTIACNKDDQKQFPDCRWDFVNALNSTLAASEIKVEVCAPYIGMTKWQIVQRAKEIKAPWEDTWSCYVGGIEPCGKCVACKLRMNVS